MFAMEVDRMHASALYKNGPATLQSGLVSLLALSSRLMRGGGRFERLLREIEYSQFDLLFWREAVAGQNP